MTTKTPDSARGIEGTTRVVGIFGDPVDHSLSPRMHNAAFRALGLDYVYVPFRPVRAGIRAAVEAIRTLGLVGVNVTVPFKEDVMRNLDRVSDTARAAGAVNTIIRHDSKLIGDNTDVPGFAAALAAGGFKVRAKRTLVIGAGGGARGVVHALLEGGAADVVIANRTRARARALAKAFSKSRRASTWCRSTCSKTSTSSSPVSSSSTARASGSKATRSSTTTSPRRRRRACISIWPIARGSRRFSSSHAARSDR